LAIRILTLPFDPSEETFGDGPLQDFLRGKHVQRIEPQFFRQDGRSYWTVFVEYVPVLNDPPVRGRDAEGLSDSERRLLDELRAWRKETAEAQGLPVYVVATNRQLLDLVKMAPTTKQGLGNIHGFGKKKLQQYGESLLRIIDTFFDRTGAWEPVTNAPADSRPPASVRALVQHPGLDPGRHRGLPQERPLLGSLAHCRAGPGRFFFHQEGELLALGRELREGTYRPGPHQYFHIRDPKPRRIAVAPFRDRVVHHAVVRVLTPVFEPTFIYDSSTPPARARGPTPPSSGPRRSCAWGAGT
jgi:HRDC domain